MKFITFLTSMIYANDSLKELNEQVLRESKLFWTDQFKVFEETGFTHDMIVGAKEIYFSSDFSEKMGGA